MVPELVQPADMTPTCLGGETRLGKVGHATTQRLSATLADGRYLAPLRPAPAAPSHASAPPPQCPTSTVYWRYPK